MNPGGNIFMPITVKDKIVQELTEQDYADWSKPTEADLIAADKAYVNPLYAGETRDSVVYYTPSTGYDFNPFDKSNPGLAPGASTKHWLHMPANKTLVLDYTSWDRDTDKELDREAYEADRFLRYNEYLKRRSNYNVIKFKIKNYQNIKDDFPSLTARLKVEGTLENFLFDQALKPEEYMWRHFTNEFTYGRSYYPNPQEFDGKCPDHLIYFNAEDGTCLLALHSVEAYLHHQYEVNLPDRINGGDWTLGWNMKVEIYDADTDNNLTTICFDYVGQPEPITTETNDPVITSFYQTTTLLLNPIPENIMWTDDGDRYVIDQGETPVP